MPQNQAANNFATTLSAAITSTSQTTMTLATLSGAPSYPYLLTLTTSGATGPPYNKVEIVQVTGLSSGTTVNIARAQEGTTAQTWGSGDNASNNFTAGGANGLMQATWLPDWQNVMVLPPASTISWNQVSGSGSITTYGGPGGTNNAPLFSSFTLATGTTASSGAWVKCEGPAFNLDASSGNGYGLIGLVQFATLPAAAGDLLIIGLNEGTNTLRLEVSYSNGTQLITSSGSVTSSIPINDTNWHRFMIWVTATTTYLFIDGALAATSVTSPPTDSVNLWQVSCDNGSASTTNVTATLVGLTVVQGW